jgi:hypothetical protein
MKPAIMCFVMTRGFRKWSRYPVVRICMLLCVTNVWINRKQGEYFVIGIYTLLVSVEDLGLSEKIVRFFNVNSGVFVFEVH